MPQEIDNAAYYPAQQNSFDFKKLIYRVLSKWYWFAISCTVALVLAFLFNKYMPPEYAIRSSLIVSEYDSGITRVNLSQGASNEGQTAVFSRYHTGRLTSFIMNYNAIQNLNWNISWYEKTPMYGKDLYGAEPYKVSLAQNKSNMQEVPVFISKISDTEYLATVDCNAVKGNMAIPIKFSQKGKFGEPFENNYFNFTIDKVGDLPVPGKEFYFEINNLANLTLGYQNRLKVITNEKVPDWIELLVTDSNPQRGVDFLNKLEQTYIEYGLAEKNRVAENTMKFIDSQLKSVTDSLSDSGNRFTNFRTRTQAVDLNQEGGLVMQKQEALETEKASLEGRLEYLRKLLTDMNDSKQMKQVVVPSVFGITDLTLNSLVTRLSDLVTRREVLSFTVQEKAPSLILMDKEIQLTHNMLAQNINSLIVATEADLDNLLRRSGGFSSQLSLLPRTEQQLTSLKRSFDLNNELYTFLLKMRAESAITYASNQPDVKIMDPARIEMTRQTSPMPIINYIVAIFLGIMLPFGIILLKDLINDSIQSKDELTDLTSLPIAGVIEHSKSKSELVVHENTRSNITESFRLLRTNLKYILSGEDKKVIAVQSSVSGEGKSFVSMNLASILAMNNLKVLLIGVDMRMSTLHHAFKSNNKKGLSTYLSHQNNFAEVLEATPIKNLDYIPSGPVPPNPAELLESGNFDRLLEEAKSRYDYIILDSPPASLVTDGIITGSQADVNLFVVRLRYSNKEQVKFINEIESKSTLPNIAIVINDARNENFGGGYYHSKRNKGYFGG